MPSPFPGMDPYLEGYLWPDVHHRLSTEISRRLTPRLRPRYVARLEISVMQDRMAGGEIGIMYPDVEIVRVMRREEPSPHPSAAPTGQAAVPSPFAGEEEGGGVATITDVDIEVGVAVAPGAETAGAEAITPPLVVPAPEVRQVTIEIRDVAHNELVTCIEVLSPVNKREPGLQAHAQKIQRLAQSGVHVLEIDLLRRGVRLLNHPRLPDTPYLATLSRAHTGMLDVWPIGLRDPLPVLAVPLRPPDRDLPLDLGKALVAVYDEAAYDLSIDYVQSPPPPPFAAEDGDWIGERVRKFHEP